MNMNLIKELKNNYFENNFEKGKLETNSLACQNGIQVSKRLREGDKTRVKKRRKKKMR